MSDEDFLIERALLDALLGPGTRHWIDRVIWYRDNRPGRRFECVGFGDFWIENPHRSGSLYVAETSWAHVKGNGWIYWAGAENPPIWPPVSSFGELIDILRDPAFRERYGLPPS